MFPPGPTISDPNLVRTKSKGHHPFVDDGPKILVQIARLIAASSTACWGRKRQARNGHAKGE